MGHDKDELERELPEHDGQRPDEQAGPTDCEADAKRAEFRPGERAGGVEQSEFETSDELHEQFPIEEIPIGTDPLDGMPVPITGDVQAAQAPAFTYDNVVCVEDDRQYVELFVEDLVERGWGGSPLRRLPPGVTRDTYRALQVQQTGDGTGALDALTLSARSRFSGDGSKIDRRTFRPEEVEQLWGVTLVMSDDADAWIAVRPIRERCIHYRRQVFSNDDQPDPSRPGHQIVFRNCTARRSNGGAYMSLRDEAVYACDHREPADETSIGRQDAKDRDKLVNRPDLVRIPLFGQPGDDVQVPLEDSKS